jgi:hypothetical protein
VTNRARYFVEDKIAQNDIVMIHVLSYYLSIRVADEMLSDTIANTLKHDQQLKNTKEYFEILPPISQSNEDMSYALVSFINALFTKEQIDSMNNHFALLFLKNRL